MCEQLIQIILNSTLLLTILTLAFGGVVASTVAGRISRNIKISEFREKWIAELRTDIANFVGVSHRWIRSYEEYNEKKLDEKPDFERDKMRPIQNEALVILFRIKMRINPLANSPTKKRNDDFLKSLDNLINPGVIDPRSLEKSWFELATSAVERSRVLLKQEWDVAKQVKKWI
jgi:hypothetical protein